MGIILLCIGGFFIFKAKQAVGRGRINSIRAHFGRGSFIEMIKAGVMSTVYGLLALIFLGVGIKMLGNDNEQKSSADTSAEVSTP